MICRLIYRLLLISTEDADVKINEPGYRTTSKEKRGKAERIFKLVNYTWQKIVRWTFTMCKLDAKIVSQQDGYKFYFQIKYLWPQIISSKE